MSEERKLTKTERRYNSMSEGEKNYIDRRLKRLDDDLRSLDGKLQRTEEALEKSRQNIERKRKALLLDEGLIPEDFDKFILKKERNVVEEIQDMIDEAPSLEDRMRVFIEEEMNCKVEDFYVKIFPKKKDDSGFSKAHKYVKVDFKGLP